MKKVDLFFYIHPYFWPKGEIPQSADVNWAGFGFGPYTWTIQTYLRLKQAGLNCHLTSIIPESGVLIAHRESLSSIAGFFTDKVVPGKKLFIVDISADLGLYPLANLHIVQNRRQEYYEQCYYMPHWPQPALVPRCVDRGEKFKNIAFLGNKKNLAREFNTDEFLQGLEKLSLDWVVRDQVFDHLDIKSYSKQSNWNDFSEVDAVVAIRGIWQGTQGAYDHKPPSKLFNAWVAGVPAILGKESAYCYERRSELDYLEANSIEDVLCCLKLLKNGSGLRKRMVANGFERAKEINANSTTIRWFELLQNVITPKYDNWIRKSRFNQVSGLYLKSAKHQLQRLKKKLLKVI